jgi:voltage-gated potassium channel
MKSVFAPPKPAILPASLQVLPLHWWRRYPVACFLVALVFAIATGPFEERLRHSELLEALVFTVVMVFALLAVGGKRRTLTVGLVLVGPALVAKWLNHFWPDLLPPPVFLVPGLLMIVFVLQQLLRFIMVARRVNSEVLCAGVAGYLLVGLLWALAYILLANRVPDAFAFTAGPASGHNLNWFAALYFSFITMSTVGYGDIVPLSDTARMLAMMEAVTGTFYTAILISRLVALYSSERGSAEQVEPPSGN